MADTPASDSAPIRRGWRGVRRYLLGQLSPAEQDRVEEQFEDPDYFAVYQSIERRLIQDYAAGTMEPVEADLFARNYLVTEKRRGQVAITQALSEVYSTRWSIRPVRAVSLRKWVPVLAMAASLAVAAVVVIHRRPAGPVLTATARPVEAPSINPGAPTKVLPPPVENPPQAVAKAPSPGAASVPTPEAARPVPDPVPAPSPESSPPISTRDVPPSAPVATSTPASRAGPFLPGHIRRFRHNGRQRLVGRQRLLVSRGRGL